MEKENNKTPIVCQNSFVKGLKDGLPICLGYFSVSIAFGMSAVLNGIPAWAAVLISVTNLTSAGQVAGIGLIAAQSTFIEMALTQLIINLRYALMSLSWSQKIDSKVSLPERMLIAFGNTDEIFAVSSAQEGTLGTKYMLGLILTPFIGWTAGTLVGAVGGNFLPESIRMALGIAIYGMFLAIIIPPAKHEKSVAVVLIFAIALSCLFYYLPALNTIGSGFVIIICAVAASAFGAWRFPRREADMAEDLKEDLLLEEEE